jgi:hypothetical protein
VDFGTAGHHHVGIAVFDHATGLADAVQAGGARRHDGQVGPLEAKRMDTWPEIMLMMEAGTKNGVMRRGPRFGQYSAWVFSISGRPPMPEPMTQAMRVGQLFVSASPVGKPASCTAWPPRRCRNG